MTAPDPIALLQRLAALRGAGLEVPPGLVHALVDWLTDAYGAVLQGVPFDQAFGLAGRRGQSSIATRHRREARDRLLRALWAQTDPDLSQVGRGALVQERARQCRPAWPVPADPRSVVRICTGNRAFPVMDGGEVQAEGGAIEATST